MPLPKNVNRTRGLDQIIPIESPRQLDVVFDPNEFTKVDSLPTLAFHPHKAWVVARGQQEEVSYIVVVISQAATNYLALVFATPETDWAYYDTAFFTGGIAGVHTRPFARLLSAVEPHELLGMFFDDNV